MSTLPSARRRYRERDFFRYSDSLVDTYDRLYGQTIQDDIQTVLDDTRDPLFTQVSAIDLYCLFMKYIIPRQIRLDAAITMNTGEE
jgi:hypothetical protein